MFALKWNPTQFKLDIHLQMYQETDGSLTYLKGHTVRKLVSVMKYMILLITQDRLNAQKHNLVYFISGNKLFKLTANDMKSSFVNEKLENHASQTISSKRAKVVKPNSLTIQSQFQPLFRLLVLIQMTLQSQFQPLFKLLSSRKVSNQMNHLNNVATSHLKDPISTTNNLDEASPLNTSCDPLTHLDSPSLSSESQDNSSVDCVEIEFHLESEEQLDHAKLSPTDVFSEHHDYELFLLQKEFGAPNDNPNHYDIDNCEIQDDTLIHASLNYKWTIDLHDGYPLFQIMVSEGYIMPSLHIHKLIFQI